MTRPISRKLPVTERPSLQERLDKIPPPDPGLLNGTTADRRNYEEQQDRRIKYRTWLLFESLEIDERVFDTALGMRHQPDHYEKALALRDDPRFEEALQGLARIHGEETAISQAWVKKQMSCVLCGGPDGCYRHNGVCDRCHLSTPSTPPACGIAPALARARSARMPATLTEEEWQRTVDHFGDRCAYCGGPWCLVEHPTPIPRGGTTMDNCLPACMSCNNTKRNATIEELEPTERVLVALAWLHSCGRPKVSS